MNAPLIRTLEQAEALDRARQSAEWRELVPLAIARGWIKYPQPPASEPRQPDRHNEKRKATRLV
jgi:hypothetical protein